jgi:heme a synthase
MTDRTLTQDQRLSWLERYTGFVLVSVLLLIFMGALVKSHEAGLTVPDWPTTYGQNMFLYPYDMWIGGIFFEHGHRLLASAIGVFTVVLTTWLFFAPVSKALKTAGLLALTTVIIQGVLGGLTVLYLLPDSISIAHGVLAQTFLLLIVFIGFKLEHRSFISFNTRAYEQTAQKIFWYLSAGVGLLYLQLLLGAMTRHAEAGLAIPDFPLMGGQMIPLFDDKMFATINEWRQARYLPEVSLWQVAIHLAHRIGAIVVGIYFAVLVSLLLRTQARSTSLFRGGLFLAALVILQLTLGVITVWSERAPWLTSMHVVCGAALLAETFALTLRAGVEGGCIEG